MSFYLMHRGAMEHPLFAGEKFTRYQAWEWLISEASFEPHKIKHPHKMEFITVNRGQIPITYSTMRDKWKWSNDKIRSFLTLLVDDAMITLETGRGFSVITICNYNLYQIALNQNRTQIGTQTGRKSVQASVHHIDNTLKELKEGEITVDDDMRVENIFSWLEKFLNSPHPFITAPIVAWLSWNANFESDIRPVAERWKKSNPTRAMKSLTWLDSDIARSIQQRNKPMPEVELPPPKTEFKSFAQIADEKTEENLQKVREKYANTK